MITGTAPTISPAAIPERDRRRKGNMMNRQAKATIKTILAALATVQSALECYPISEVEDTISELTDKYDEMPDGSARAEALYENIDIVETANNDIVDLTETVNDIIDRLNDALTGE